MNSILYKIQRLWHRLLLFLGIRKPIQLTDIYMISWYSVPKVRIMNAKWCVKLKKNIS